MSKKYYRFFGGMMVSQERWLNKMADEGFRLIGTGRMTYEFEKCEPKKYEYRVEYIGNKSKADAESYAAFLREFGYTVFFKNINLNYNVGKAVFRPWADKGGRISTNWGTLNRELLIVEKERDGTKFQLHTTYEDRVKYYKSLMKPWLFIAVIYAVLAAALHSVVWGVFALAGCIGTVIYLIEIAKLKKDSDISEW